MLSETNQSQNTNTNVILFQLHHISRVVRLRNGKQNSTCQGLGKEVRWGRSRMASSMFYWYRVPVFTR